MNAAIITVGDEILIGQVVNTNAAWLGQELSFAGLVVKKNWTLKDDHEEIISGLHQATEEADIIFMTGGLGPTKDDITKKAIADFLGVELFFHQETFERIKKIFAKIGREISVHHHDQCLMPVGVEILQNRMGTAPGMLLRYKGKMIISMPGVPYEMKAIMQDEVLPMVKDISDTKVIHKTILTFGTGETIIENRISDIVDNFPAHLQIAYLPTLAQVRLRLSAVGKNKLELEILVNEFVNEISDRLKDIIFGYDESTLEIEIKNLCIEKGITLSTAESCTGGAVAVKIVEIPGSSAYFKGGVVSYSNEIKTNLLKVSSRTIELNGAVSEQTVIEMVAGAIKLLKTDVAVAISGIAGPDGGTAEKPVGTIWICAGNEKNQTTKLIKAGKDRSKNIEIAALNALDMVRMFIIDNY